MQLPRFLWVPFELGRPFGAPHQPEFQRRVLHEALSLLERHDGPVVLADFADDAPAVDSDEAPWTCPISFLPAPRDDTDPVARVRTEVGALAPWAEVAAAPQANTGLPPEQLIDELCAVIEAGDALTAVELERVRLVADDLRTWYLHAALQQPGRASSRERNTWFWTDTAAARMLGRVAAELSTHPDARTRLLAARGLIPRDHWDDLVPKLPRSTSDD